MKTLQNYHYAIGGINSSNTEVIFFDGPAVPDQAVKVTTFELCKTALNNVPQGGINPEEMYNRLQVINSLVTQKDNSEINLEDAHLSTLKKCVKDLSFVAVDAAFYHFTECIKNA